MSGRQSTVHLGPFAIACALFALLVPCTAATASPASGVLVLYSDPHTSPGIFELEVALRRELVEQFPKGVGFEVEHLGLVYNASPSYQRSLAALLQEKYADRPPKVVIAVGMSALQFVLAHRETHFAHSRILFGHVDHRELAAVSLPGDVTGLVSHWAFDEELDMALRLLPDTRRAVVILGGGPVERRAEPQIRRDFARFSQKIEVDLWVGVPMEELERRVAVLPARTVVIYVAVYRDATGAIYLPVFVLERLARHSSAPIFGRFANFVGHGIVGDGRVSLSNLGEQLGKAAVRLMRDDPPAAVGVVPALPGPPVFDARQLERWKIPRRRLPPGSTLLFEPSSVWAQYRKWFVLAGSVIALQTLLLAAALSQLIARRRAERAVHETRDLHSVVVDSLRSRIATLDRDGVILATNRAWHEPGAEAADHGCNVGVGGNFLEAARKATEQGREDARRTVEALTAVLSGSESARRVVYDPEGDGHGPRYEMNILSLHRGEGGGVVTIEDVTDRWRSDERVRFALESLPVAVVLLGPDGTIEHANAQMERLFGYGRHELVGRAIDAVLPESIPGIGGHPGPVQPAGLKAGGLTPGRGLTARRKDGSEVPVEVSAGTIHMADRNLVLASFLDLSERRRADAELLRLRTETALFGRVAAVGEMSAAIAHELNQPLTGILSNAQAAQRFLRGGTATREELWETLDDIVADSRRAGHVIQRLRTLLRKDPIEIEPLDLNEMIQQVVRLVAHDLLLRDSALDLELAENLPPIAGDRVHLQQVVLNLILNGADAMVGLPPERRRLLLRTAAGNDHMVNLEVRDYGTGITQEALRHLYEPFFTTKPHGMGMGLSIVRSIVETHGGRIAARNEEGGGATFCLTLPVSR